jgi:hypothetical protein
MGAKNEQLELERAGLKGNRAYERFRDGGKKTLREDLPPSLRRHSRRRQANGDSNGNGDGNGNCNHALDRATTPKRPHVPTPTQRDIDTLTSVNVTLSPNISPYISSFHSVLRNCRVRACPHSARARPSWIIRGACPMHDLMEVQMGEENGRKRNRKTSASA